MILHILRQYRKGWTANESSRSHYSHPILRPAAACAQFGFGVTAHAATPASATGSIDSLVDRLTPQRCTYAACGCPGIPEAKLFEASSGFTLIIRLMLDGRTAKAGSAPASVQLL